MNNPPNLQLLDSALECIRNAPPESLPKMLALLTELQATITARLHSAMPAPAPAEDTYLSAKQAAAKLGCSRDYLYKRPWPFTRKLGGKTLFSARGIDEYLRKGKTL